MSEHAPRTWKDFDQRWRRTSRVEKFIFVSIVCHLLLGVCWLLPHHLEQRRQRRLRDAQRQIEEQRRRQAEEEAAKLEQELRKQEQKALAEEQLRELFDELVGEHLPPADKRQAWEQLMEELSEQLAALSDTLAGDDPDTDQVEKRVERLRAQMVEKLYQRLAREAQAAWKKRYLQSLRQMADALAHSLQGEIDKEISAPLAGEARNIFKRETDRARREIADARQRLQKVSKAAAAARQALTRKTQARNLADAQQHAARMDQDLRRTAEHLDDLTPDLAATTRRLRRQHLVPAAKALRTASDALAKAGQKHRKPSTPPSAPDAAKALSGAAAELGKLRKEAGALERRLAKLDPAALARQRMRRLAARMERQDLRPWLRREFDQAYLEQVLPELAKKLDAQFQAEAEKRGLVPPDISVAGEIKEILGKKFLDKVEAGKSSTARLRRSQQLDAQQGAPGRGRLEQRTAAKLRQAARAVGRAGVKKLSAMLTGKTRLDTNQLADARLDEALQARALLLDKLGSLRNQVAHGRTTALGTADLAALTAARRRSRALSRSRAGRRGKHYVQRDRLAYLAMIEKMKHRAGARGKAYALRGASGKTAEAKPTYEPGLVLAALPPAPTRPPKRKREYRKPGFKYNRFTGVPYLNRPLVIDGKLDDWRGIPAHRLTWVNRGGDSHSSFRVAYDNRGIYFAVEVAVDANPGIQDKSGIGDFWLNDCVELFLDTRNTKFRRRGESHTKQFFLFPLGHRQEREIGGYEAVFTTAGTQAHWVTNRRYPLAVFPRAGRKTAKGWVVECMVSKRLLAETRLTPGRIIGFTIGCDMGGDHYAYWAWAKGLQPSTNPNSWGDIQLLGSDARIELLQEDRKHAKSGNTIIPGEPLVARITDRDMNLDDAVRDKVSLSVVTAAGGRAEMILQETGPASGVFVGSIATRPGIGVPTPGVLDLYDGDRLRLIYIDQAQAYGETNVRVIVKVRAGSAGARFLAASPSR